MCMGYDSQIYLLFVHISVILDIHSISFVHSEWQNQFSVAFSFARKSLCRWIGADEWLKISFWLLLTFEI